MERRHRAGNELRFEAKSIYPADNFCRVLSRQDAGVPSGKHNFCLGANSYKADFIFNYFTWTPFIYFDKVILLENGFQFHLVRNILSTRF